MRIRVVDRPERGDALSRFDEGLPAPERYSEWHHFTFHDDVQDLHGIVNLAVSGDVRDPDRSRAGLSLVVAEQGRWRGTMNLYGIEDATFHGGAVDLALAGHSVRLEGDHYMVRAGLKNGSVGLEAVWMPRADGVRVDNIGGVVSTFILPRLEVEGWVEIEGRRYDLAGAAGYHDHNWGYWTWGRDLGWDWGYAIEAPAEAASRTVVFGQVTDASRDMARSDLVMVVWEGARCTSVFLDDAVRLTTDGEMPPASVPRVPGVLALVEGKRRAVPRRVVVRADDGEDWLELALEASAGLQFLVPHGGGPGLTTVSELVGRYSVKGVLDGHPVDFARSGFAERAG